MALPKKGSSPITVDDVAYRWMVGTNEVSLQDHLHHRVIVANAEDNGRILEVTCRRHLMHGIEDDVTPGKVSAWIQQEVASGWDSTSGGPPFQMDAEL